MTIPILLETKDYIVLNKPAGISVHGDGKSDQYTVADWLLETYPELRDVGEPALYNGVTIHRPGIIHRLDKDTTGCLLVAKNQETFLYFKKQFQEHQIQKMYHTFVYGSIKEVAGKIVDPIGRSRGDVRKWGVGKGARGVMRDAVTEYTVHGVIGGVLGRGSTEEGVFSFVECRPKTGRTHQIRVHMKSLNHPIVSDMLYAEKRNVVGNMLGFERLALHARELSFIDPMGEHISIVAPYPKDFENALKKLSK